MSRIIGIRVSDALADEFEKKLEQMNETKTSFLTKVIECTATGTIKIVPMEITLVVEQS